MISVLPQPFGHIKISPSPRSVLALCAVCMVWVVPSRSLWDPTYENVTQIFTDKLGSASGYNTAVRPLQNQSKVINVFVGFDIIAIVDVDDIKQKFIVNGLVELSWIDEMLAWDPIKYNNVYVINPYPKQIWRPRLILGNTLDKRDLFEDDYCPTIASYFGEIFWVPGSLFPTSCKMDLKNYPFDQQTCTIDLFSMGLSNTTMAFRVNTGDVEKSLFTENGEWKILHSSVEIIPDFTPIFQVKFVLKRRPEFFVINIIVPVVVLSFLNIMVFLIPVQSGEKISYGITVLLALFVFMSIVSGMLPRSSDATPLVTLYLMTLLLISVCTVIVAILIVSFHHRDEKETKRHRAVGTFKSVFHKFRSLQRAITHFKQKTANSQGLPSVENLEEAPPLFRLNEMAYGFKNTHVPIGSRSSEPKKDIPENSHTINKWRIIGRHIDCASFVVFMAIWASVTIGFLVAIST